MTQLFNWVKNHKLIILLLLIISYLLLSKSRISSLQSTTYKSGSSELSTAIGGILPEAPPTTNVQNRLVISESYLSLLVKDVTNAQKRIIETAEQLGGYMVNSNLQNPQEAATATVVVRLPSTKLNQALEKFRGLSVKVISENLQGEDVTDQYVDNEARLATLMKTKTKFEEILDKAVQIQDILNVQQQIINLQSQIDAIKGQQKYYEQSAELSKITVYLSIDELALPYAPSETWRPAVIFKQAVRSLVGVFRKLGGLIIWLAVYSVIWIPVLLVVYLLKKRKSA